MPVSARQSSAGRWRNALAALSLVIAVVLVSLSIVAVWLNLTIMDEDGWVDTVAPLAKDPAIQDYFAISASNALLRSVDVQSLVDKYVASMPQQMRALAPRIAEAAKESVRDATVGIARSPQFPMLWERANRLSHRGFVAAVTQSDRGPVTNQRGQITLDISLLAEQTKQRLADKGLPLVNSIQIPESKREVVLFRSPSLAKLQAAIGVMNAWTWILPTLAFAFLSAGLALATDRRRAVFWAGIGVSAATLLPVQAIYLSKSQFTSTVFALGKMPDTAAQHAYDAIFRHLMTADWVAALAGGVLALGAWLGDPRGPVATRWRAS